MGRHAIERLADGLLSVLLAPACATCEQLLEHPSREVVCASCWADVHPLTPPFCETCGDALPSWRMASVSAGQCARCRRLPPQALDGRRAAGIYEGRLRQIVHAWKYDQRRSLARPLSTRVREAADDLCVCSDAVVPVPLHRARARERGFNQAWDLARLLGVPVLPALRRVRRTTPQVLLPARLRRKNVRDAFALAPASLASALRRPGWRPRALTRNSRVEATRGLIAGRHLLLVDDVCTTGATLEACARVLKEAGAARVYAATVARAVTGRPR